MKKIINCLLLIVFLFPAICASNVSAANTSIYQQNVITKKGVVLDEKGETMPGVNVSIKGTTEGVNTDLDGAFILDVKLGDIILISFVGYKDQEIKVTDSKSIQVKLVPDTENLDEIVIVGYGQVKKGDVTGAVQTVSTKDFNIGGTSSPQDLIVGKVAGVQITSDGGAPGSGSKIRIRGGSSMSASNDPLIVIDGIPVDNKGISGMSNVLSSINPNDIETFTVLKDASSTAIYGSRASNGVVLITTKRGKKGQDMKVSFDSKFSMGQIIKTVDVLSAEEYRDLVLARKAAGDAINPSLMGVANTNWQDNIFETSYGQDYNVGVSGSVLNLPFRASVGYTNQDGILKTSNMERTTGTLNLSPSFLDNSLRINMGVKVMKVKNRFADKSAVSSAVQMDPTQLVRSFGEQYEKYDSYYTWLMPSDGTRNVNGTRNPLAMLNQVDDSSKVNRLIADFKMDYSLPFLKELTATFKLGTDVSDSNGSKVTDHLASWAQADGAGVNREYTQEKKNELLDFYLNYSKDLKEINSSLGLMAGYEWQHFWSKKTARDEDIKRKELEKSEDETENYLVSFFTRLNYSFMSKYLLTVTVRQDGSSRFHEDNRWGLFPSAALAWRIKEEGFLQDIEAISNLKLRVGYGVTGQQELNSGDYPYLGTYNIGDNRTQYQMGDKFYSLIRPNGYDKNLKWEETTTYNVALDYGFFNNRISGSLDFYKRKTDNLLNTVPVPAGTNFTDRLLTNVGSLENSGYEVSINVVPVSNEDTYWEVGFNLSHNENKLTQLTNYSDPNFKGIEVGGISGVGVGNTIQIQAIDHPLNTFYVYEQKYSFRGKVLEGEYVDRNEDGKIDTKDKYYAGSPEPEMFMGFSSNFTYKNLDFGFNGRISLDNQVYNNVSVGGAYEKMTKNEYLTNLPSDLKNTHFAKTQQYSDYYLEDASFVKLDNITLGYSFKNLFKTASSKSGLNLRLYATVQNVFTVTDYKGLDPEVGNGIDYNMYPRPRTYTFGISARF
ncbi:MAG: TonB-dependent receptor [Marinifilaceae bacterium]